ncbi:MAG: DUF2851 family protein [Balneolales bacterium]|nr:DUF2851 family protein [Balneolales bacterium]
MKEHKLQQLWQQLAFGRHGHRTLCGLTFMLENPGEFNPGDGPDFRLGAIRTADGLLLRGDIELHVHEQQWQEHGHSTDPAYNGVVLHVFLYPSAKPVKLKSGQIPLRCSLLPVIKPEQFADLQPGSGLPCSASVRYLKPEIVHRQLEKAREAYFASRAEALMCWWEPALGIEQAWKQMALRGAASVFGLSRNRDAMVQLSGHVPGLLRQGLSADALQAKLLELSGLISENSASAPMKRTDWDFSGSRPGNKPRQRIGHLAVFATRLDALSRSDLLKGPEWCARQVLSSGKRNELLYLIVWLPAFYLLGSILASGRLQQEAWQHWKTHHYEPEPVFSQAFEAAGFKEKASLSHLGVVHQYRSWCAQKRCGECSIGRLVPDSSRPA